jgi:hypothetical protein
MNHAKLFLRKHFGFLDVRFPDGFYQLSVVMKMAP